jgi:hypothetical protein
MGEIVKQKSLKCGHHGNPLTVTQGISEPDPALISSSESFLLARMSMIHLKHSQKYRLRAETQGIHNLQ